MYVIARLENCATRWEVVSQVSFKCKPSKLRPHLDYSVQFITVPRKPVNLDDLSFALIFDSVDKAYALLSALSLTGIGVSGYSVFPVDLWKDGN